MPSGLMRCRSSKRFTASATVASKTGTWIFFVRRIEIAFDRQPLPQRRHDGRLLIRLEPRVGRNRRPAAFRRDRAIAHQSLLQLAIFGMLRLELFHRCGEIVVLHRIRQHGDESGFSGFNVHSDCSARGSRRPPVRCMKYRKKRRGGFHVELRRLLRGDLHAASRRILDWHRVERARQAVIVGGVERFERTGDSAPTGCRRQSRSAGSSGLCRNVAPDRRGVCVRRRACPGPRQRRRAPSLRRAIAARRSVAAAKSPICRRRLLRSAPDTRR